jgi:hypothetical protein
LTSNQGDEPIGAIKTPEKIDHERRRFFGAAAMTIAAAQFGILGFADAQSSKADSAIGNPAASKMPLPPKFTLAFWYQYYFATDIGQAGYEKYLHDFAKLIWQTASPKWDFDDATFERSAAALNNPDTSLSRSTTIAGASDWPTASGNTTTWKSDWPSVCPPSPWKATPTVQSISTAQHIAISSRASMNTVSSLAASATTCRKKLRKPSPKLSSTLMAFENVRRHCRPPTESAGKIPDILLSDLNMSARKSAPADISPLCGAARR